MTDSSASKDRASVAGDTAGEELLLAAKRVLRGLNSRIEHSPVNAKPIFDGIADLHDAINAYERSKK